MAERIVTKDSTIIWHGKDVLKGLDAETKKRMQKAMVYLHTKVRRNVSITATIIRSERLDGTGPLKYPIRQHSSPGEYPRVVTGQLRRRIFRRGPYIRGKKIMADVGTTLDYAIHHELTGRSFLRRTAAEEAQTIAKILSEHVGGKAVATGGSGFKFSAATVAQARSMAAAGRSISEIASVTGMSTSHARNVVRGRTRRTR